MLPPPARHVQHHASMLDTRRRLGTLRTAQNRLDARKKHGWVVRLRDVVIGAEVHAQNLVELAVGRREHDDGHLTRAPEIAADRMAARAGKLEVEDHAVGRSRQNIVHDAVEGGAGQRGMTLQFEQAHKLLAQRRVVFHDEYPCHSPSSHRPHKTAPSTSIPPHGTQRSASVGEA